MRCPARCPAVGGFSIKTFVYMSVRIWSVPSGCPSPRVDSPPTQRRTCWSPQTPGADGNGYPRPLSARGLLVGIPTFEGCNTVSDRPNSVTLGFLTVLQEPTGWVGGYLVTNAWGRPVEFRLTTAVQPNRVQTVLYGPTLSEYLHADVIGKALVEKTSTKPDLILTDCPAALGLRSRVDIPVIALRPDAAFHPTDTQSFTHARSPVALLLATKFAADEPAILALLDAVDPVVDLGEPFVRVREAVSEARKMGVTGRAA